MQSSNLTNYRFLDWLPFSTETQNQLIPALPSKIGVYVIKYKSEFGRFIGESDIVYIGSTTNKGGLKARIRQYFHPGPTQLTNIRINEMLSRKIGFSISFKTTFTKEEARETENLLLGMYYQDHLELPPQNRRY